MTTDIHRIPLAYRNALGHSREVNAYFLVKGPSAVLIDTGYDAVAHAAQIRSCWDALGKPHVECILLTHAHPDHAGGVDALQRQWQVPVALHPLEQQHLEKWMWVWRPDIYLEDGMVLQISVGHLKVLHSPGHSPGHTCFLLEETHLLFSGDNVLAGMSTLISPPNGDMTHYLASLRALVMLPITSLAPGHGEMIREGQQRVLEVLEHRIRREGEILALVRTGHRTVEDIATVLYGADTNNPRRNLGKRIIESYLQHLASNGRIHHDDDTTWAIIRSVRDG